MTREKRAMTPDAAAALRELGPEALRLLGRLVAAVDPGKVETCSHCELRKVENYRNEQVRANLRSIHDKLAKLVEEAAGVGP